MTSTPPFRSIVFLLLCTQAVAATLFACEPRVLSFKEVASGGVVTIFNREAQFVAPTNLPSTAELKRAPQLAQALAALSARRNTLENISKSEGTFSLDVAPAANALDDAGAGDASTEHHGRVLTFWLRESLSGPLPFAPGGSSFYVQSVSLRDDAVSSCKVKPHRDSGGASVYTVRCVNRGDAQIHVMLSHVSFGAYVPLGDDSVLEEMRVPLFACNYTAFPPPTPDDAQAPVSSFCTREQLADDWGGAWHRSSPVNASYVPTSGCKVPNTTAAALVASVPRLVMIGSSHMRYAYDATVQQLGFFKAGLEVKHVDDETENVAYVSKHYIVGGPEFPDVGILHTLRNLSTSLPPRSLVVMQFGSWSLHGVGLMPTIREAEELLPAVRTLVSRGVRVVWLPPPSYPRGSQTGTWAGQRNNHAYAALAQAFEPGLRAAGGFLFDDLTMSRAFTESLDGFEWQCGDHVLCNRGGIIVGPVGLEIIRVLLAFLALLP